MATTTKLVLTMETANGDKNFSYNYVNGEITTSRVKSIGTALVTNGDIFTNPPLSTKAAYISTTTTTDYDISD